MKEPLTARNVKPRPLGHLWSTPGVNFVYAQLNRVIKARDLSVIYIAGLGHSGPGLVANAYLEGTYSEVYPDVSGRGGPGAALHPVFVPGGIRAASPTPQKMLR